MSLYIILDGQLWVCMIFYNNNYNNNNSNNDDDNDNIDTRYWSIYI